MRPGKKGQGKFLADVERERASGSFFTAYRSS